MNDCDEKEKVQVFEGIDSQVELCWSRIEISRKGFGGVVSHGLAGTKIIFIRNLTAIQFKEAGKATNGFIQFIFPGSAEDKGGLFSAARDENTVMFTEKQQPEFEKLRDIIIARHDF